MPILFFLTPSPKYISIQHKKVTRLEKIYFAYSSTYRLVICSLYKANSFTKVTKWKIILLARAPLKKIIKIFFSLELIDNTCMSAYSNVLYSCFRMICVFRINSCIFISLNNSWGGKRQRVGK